MDFIVQIVLLILYFKTTAQTSCFSEVTYCEVGIVCDLRKPKIKIYDGDLTGTYYKFKDHRNKISFEDNNFSFTPLLNYSATEIVDFCIHRNNCTCSSTVYISTNVPVNELTCNADRKTVKLVCVIKKQKKYNYTMNISNYRHNAEKCTENDDIYTCPIHIQDVALQHIIYTAKTSNKVINSSRATNNFTKFIYNMVKPSTLDDVLVEFADCFTMMLSTTKPNDTFIPLSDVTLIFNISLQNIQNLTTHVYQVKNKSSLELTIHKLHAYTNYTLSIEWSVVGSEYWSSDFFDSFQTEACVPSASPTLFRNSYSLTKNKQIVLYWKKIPKNRENGPDLTYEVYKMKPNIIPYKDLQKLVSFTDPKINTFSYYSKTSFTLEESFSGSNISGMLHKGIREGDVLVMGSRNSVGLSDKLSVIQILTDSQVSMWPRSIDTKHFNNTHWRLNWVTQDSEGERMIYIFSCYGRWFQNHNEMECLESFDNIRKISTFKATMSYFVEKQTDPERPCNQCSWHYGISVKHNDVASPIVWVADIKADVLEDITHVYVILAVVIVAFLLTICCLALIIKRMKYCPKYNISLPFTYEFQPNSSSGETSSSTRDHIEFTSINSQDTGDTSPAASSGSNGCVRGPIISVRTDNPSANDDNTPIYSPTRLTHSTV